MRNWLGRLIELDKKLPCKKLIITYQYEEGEVTIAVLPLPRIYEMALLVFGPKQIVYRFYGIKCRQWNLYKYCIPVAHGAIPQARKFQSFQLFAVFALRTDKSSIMVNEIGQMESIATIVSDATNEVDRIEVCTFLKSLYVFCIVAVYLATFKNLQANSSVSIISKERTATRFTNILHHTTHTYGSV